MARFSRLVVPGMPHHVTQRGNRRQQTFFKPDDYRLYLDLMAQWCLKFGNEIWSYCLMPNHVHLIVVPQSEDGLARALGEAHKHYTRRINFRQDWKGHLWQGRFASFVMDEPYLLAAARYIELNPVRASLVERPQDYPWSSAKAHLSGRDDGLVKTAPLLGMTHDWAAFLSSATAQEKTEELVDHGNTGRPLGGEEFLLGLEAKTGRSLHKGKPGPRMELEIIK